MKWKYFQQHCFPYLFFIDILTWNKYFILNKKKQNTSFLRNSKRMIHKIILFCTKQSFVVLAQYNFLHRDFFYSFDDLTFFSSAALLWTRRPPTTTSTLSLSSATRNVTLVLASPWSTARTTRSSPRRWPWLQRWCASRFPSR